MPLLVFEGIDGCGKTTQVERLVARLHAEKIAHRRLREPGGTKLGEAMRAILLDPQTQACALAELLTYLSARAQLCNEVLGPALAAGELVVLDRFWPSTMAYQASGLGLPWDGVRAAIDLAVGDVKMDLCLWFDVTPEVAERRRAGTGKDRIEARGIEYQRRVRLGYERLAASHDITRISADFGPNILAAIVWEHVSALLRRPRE